MIPAVLQGSEPSHPQLSNTQGRLRSILGTKLPLKMRGVRCKNYSRLLGLGCASLLELG